MSTLSVDTPRLFRHELDASLFSGERLDALCRRADELGQLKVQFADPGRQRYGNDPIYTHASYPLLEDVMRRPIQYRIMGVSDWGGPEYEACLEHVLEVAAPDASLGRHDVTTVVRVFSPRVIVALHGDPDLKLVCDVSGTTTWYARHPDEMQRQEHEDLLRGNFFLEWRDAPETPLPIPAGRGCFVPSRWAHWLDHPCDEPVVSFEIGFWTNDSIRERKVHDVNWLLRRARLTPAEPGQGNDALKCRVFDTISTLTRRGTQYRGIS
jgi:hypothetical protein